MIKKDQKYLIEKYLPTCFPRSFFKIKDDENEKYSNAIINFFYKLNFSLIISIIKRTSFHLGSKTLQPFIKENFNETQIQKLIKLRN